MIIGARGAPPHRPPSATRHRLKRYLTWTDTDAIAGEQYAWARASIHDTIDFTWASLSANSSGSSTGSAPRLQQAR